MIKRYTIGISALTASLLLVANSAVSQPAPDQLTPVPDFEVVAVTESDATPTISADLKTDLKIIAEENKISLEEAVEHYGWQNDFAKIVEEARTFFPETYVSAEASDSDDAPTWIAFTEVPQEWVAERLPTVATEIEVRQLDALTELEQNERVQEVHYSIQNLPFVEDASSSIDPLTGHVSVEYVVSADAVLSAQKGSASNGQSQLSPDGVETLLSKTNSTLDLDNVSITRTQGSLGEPEALVGGGQLKSNGSAYCTAAFTVTKSGVNGILTANHCNKLPLYYGTYKLTNKASNPTSMGDVRWLSTTESISNEVWATSTSKVRITSKADPVAGQTLSFYGRTTGASTDKVYKLNECSGGYCGMVMMHRHHTDGGDSGGPWRSGNTAYGVHHGYKTVLLIERSLFTRVNSAVGGMGVTIKVTP